VDTELFINHKYGNWYGYLKETGSLPLKIVIENQQFTLESIAVEVKPMRLDDKFFLLPENIKTAKSLY
jgi:hypothetical protein